MVILNGEKLPLLVVISCISSTGSAITLLPLMVRTVDFNYLADPPAAGFILDSNKDVVIPIEVPVIADGPLLGNLKSAPS